jgi:hypothetical protein
MFCNHCGSRLAPGQTVCRQCGNAVSGVIAPSRVAQHLTIMGVLWIAYSVLHAIGGAAMFILSNTIFSERYGGGHPEFLHPMFQAIGAFLLVKAVLGVLAGFGLLSRQSWARVLALVVAVVSLINIPFGTALGIYTMWVLVPEEASVEYERLAARA